MCMKIEKVYDARQRHWNRKRENNCQEIYVHFVAFSFFYNFTFFYNILAHSRELLTRIRREILKDLGGIERMKTLIEERRGWKTWITTLVHDHFVLWLSVTVESVNQTYEEWMRKYAFAINNLTQFPPSLPCLPVRNQIIMLDESKPWMMCRASGLLLKYAGASSRKLKKKLIWMDVLEALGMLPISLIFMMSQ